MTRLPVLFLVLLVSAALAAGFGVAPPTVEIRLQPGTQRTGQLAVLGGRTGDRLEPKIVDWWLGPEGELELLPPGSLPRSLAPYLKIPTQPLDAGTRHELRYRVSLPEGAEGCYHAGLLLRTQAMPLAGPGVRVRTRLGFLVLFFASAEGSTKPRLRLTEARYRDGRLTAWVENTGNACLHPRAVVQALGEAGNVLTEEIAFEDYLLPGATRKIQTERSLPAEAAALRLRVEAKGVAPLIWEVGR